MSKAAAAVKAAAAANTAAQAIGSGSPSSNTLTMDQVKEIASARFGGESLFLLPEEAEPVEIGDRLEIGDEEEKVRQLADSIKAVGQKQPCVIEEVTDAKTGEISYRLHIGRRRQRAIMLLNAELPKGAAPYKMWCVVDRTSGGDKYREALMENIQRQGYSPIELAAIVERIAKSAPKGDAAAKPGPASKGGMRTNQVEYVTKYLGVSEATVRNAVKLLRMDGEVQSAVHRGTMTVDAALEAEAGVVPEKRAAVLAKAREMAAGEPATETTTILDDEGKPVAEAVASHTPAKKLKLKAAAGKAVNSKPSKPTPVGKRHVVAAARELDAMTPGKAKPRTRGEILDWVQSQDAPANGPENHPIRQWARYLVDVYAAGQGSERTLDGKFESMCIPVTPSAASKAAAKVMDNLAATTPKGKAKLAVKPKAIVKAVVLHNKLVVKKLKPVAKAKAAPPAKKQK